MEKIQNYVNIRDEFNFVAFIEVSRAKLAFTHCSRDIVPSYFDKCLKKMR